MGTPQKRLPDLSAFADPPPAPARPRSPKPRAVPPAPVSGGLPNLDAFADAPAARSPKPPASSAPAAHVVDSRLDSFVNDVIGEASKRSGYTYRLGDGLRTPAQQAQKVAQGVSWTYNSRHLSGRGRDVLAFDAKGNYIKDGAHPAYATLGEVYGERSASAPVRIRWGVVRDGRQVDPGHFELDEDDGVPALPNLDAFADAHDPLSPDAPQANRTRSGGVAAPNTLQRRGTREEVAQFAEQNAPQLDALGIGNIQHEETRAPESAREALEFEPVEHANASGAVAPSSPAAPPPKPLDPYSAEDRERRDVAAAARVRAVTLPLTRSLADYNDASELMADAYRHGARSLNIPSGYVEDWIESHPDDMRLINVATGEAHTPADLLGSPVHDERRGTVRLNLGGLSDLERDYRAWRSTASRFVDWASDPTHTAGEKFLDVAAPVAGAAARAGDLATRPLSATSDALWSLVGNYDSSQGMFGFKPGQAASDAWHKFRTGETNPSAQNLIAKKVRDSETLRNINPNLPGLVGGVTELLSDPANAIPLGVLARGGSALRGLRAVRAVEGALLAGRDARFLEFYNSGGRILKIEAAPLKAAGAVADEVPRFKVTLKDASGAEHVVDMDAGATWGSVEGQARGGSVSSSVPVAAPLSAKPSWETPPRLVSDEVLRPQNALGRDVVVVEKSDGTRQAFYRSSGQNSGQPGEWFPFGGMVDGGEYDGWFNKAPFVRDELSDTAHPLHRYGTEENKQIGAWLRSQDIPEGVEVPRATLNARLKEFGAFDEATDRYSQFTTPASPALAGDDPFAGITPQQVTPQSSALPNLDQFADANDLDQIIDEIPDAASQTEFIPVTANAPTRASMSARQTAARSAAGVSPSPAAAVPQASPRRLGMELRGLTRELGRLGVGGKSNSERFAQLHARAEELRVRLGGSPRPQPTQMLATPPNGGNGLRAGGDGLADAAPKRHDYSTTQVNLPSPLAAKIKALGQRVADADLADDGRELNPHITVKYGLHTEDAEEVRKVLAGAKPIKVRLGKTSLFEGAKSGKDFDVVKVGVDSPDLHRLNRKIARTLEVTDTHPTYKPYATVAYVKAGAGKKYAGDAALEGQEITLDRIVFSDKNGVEIEIPLGTRTSARPTRTAQIRHAARTSQDLINLTKAIPASFDNSALFGQGAIISGARPSLVPGAIGDSARSAMSRTKFEAFKRRLVTHPNHPLREESGLYLGSLKQGEETFGSRFAEHIPGVAASQRAYEATLDSLRSNAFDLYTEQLTKAGVTDPKAFKDIARWVNVAAGRGELGIAEPLAEVLNLPMFSPRLLASKFNVISPVRYARMHPAARKIALVEMFRATGSLTVTHGLAAVAGADVDLDPFSAGFGTFTAGGTSYDLSGGRLRAVRFAAQLADTFNKMRRGEQVKDNRKPAVLVEKYFRAYLSPAAALAYDAYTGTEFDGRDFEWGPRQLKRLAPFAAKEMFEAYQKAGALGAVKAAPTFLGVGVNTMERRPEPIKPLLSQENQAELDRLGLDLEHLGKRGKTSVYVNPRRTVEGITGGSIAPFGDREKTNTGMGMSPEEFHKQLSAELDAMLTEERNSPDYDTMTDEERARRLDLLLVNTERRVFNPVRRDSRFIQQEEEKKVKERLDRMGAKNVGTRAFKL